MMKNTILTILISLISLCSFALPSDDNLNEICQKIFNDLKRANGLAENHLPFLKIVNALPNPLFSMAMADSDTKMVYLEKSTAQLAIDKMDEDANNGLAYILAHELSHILRHHNSTNHFISKFQKGFLQSEDSASGLAERSADVNTFIADSKEEEFNHNIRKNEAEADLDAGFSAYLAGYKIKEAGPTFLQTIYDAKNLNSSSKKYASLDERKLILKLTGERLDTLTHIFEMGNYLTAAGEYAAAYDCYYFVSKEVASPALLNNLGVTSLLEVAEMMKAKDIKYVLPITLDLGESASKDPSLEARRKAYEKKIFLLEDAIMNFNQAASLNENYYETHINMSVAYYLKFVVKNKSKEFSNFVFDELNFALSSAIKAKQIILENKPINKKSLADAYSQMSIVYKELGMPNQSSKFINKALKELSTSFVASSNQAVLKGQSDISTILDNQSNTSLNKCRDKELVEGNLIVDDLLEDTKDKKAWNMVTPIKNKKGQFLNTVTEVRFRDHSNFYLYNVTQKVGGVENKHDLTFYVPKKTQTNASQCGIKPQSSKSDVKEKYGTESKSIETSNSSILRFVKESEIFDGITFTDGILFIIDSKQKVDKWIAFQLGKK